MKKTDLIKKAIEMGLETKEGQTVKMLKDLISGATKKSPALSDGISVTGRSGSWNVSSGILTIISISADGIAQTLTCPADALEANVTLGT